MTWYTDPSEPRLSDFLTDTLPTWPTEPWLWGSSMGSFKLLAGNVWNPDILRYECPIPSSALLGNKTWADVVFSPGATAYDWGMSYTLDETMDDLSGSDSVRRARVVAALRARLEVLGVDGSNLVAPTTWTQASGSSVWYGYATGISGDIVFADPGIDDREAASLYLDEYRSLIWSGTVGDSAINSDWRSDVQAWLEDKVANNGWRFFKPWQEFPQVRPLMHRSNFGTSRTEAYSAGPDWVLGIDWWSIVSKRKGDRVPWLKWTYYQDLRDPGDENYATWPWWPEVGFQTASYPNRLYVLSNDQTGLGSYTFIETLDGQRPTNGTEAENWLGADVSINSSIPGLVTASSGYFNWEGWKDPGDTGTYTRGVPMRVHKVKSSSADLTGVTSMEQLLAKPTVKLSYTAELYPYSDVGPSVDSTFGVVPFEGEPSGDVRLRLSAG